MGDIHREAAADVGVSALVDGWERLRGRERRLDRGAAAWRGRAARSEGLSSDFSGKCFVVMPYRTRPVKTEAGERPVDFDALYERLYRPALQGISLPEGGTLSGWRADEAFFSGVISTEMYSDLEYSRLVAADVSCVNANVFYELGIRHHARSAGMVLFRQRGVAIPFDIKDVRVFEYEAETEAQLAASQKTIRRSVEATLAHGAVDSPVRVALAAQAALAGPPFQDALRRAEQATQERDRAAAIDCLREAIGVGPVAPSVRLRLGVLLKDEGRFEEAVAVLHPIVAELPDNPDVLRELGIAENESWYLRGRPAGEATGEEALRRAVDVAPDDFEAWASLGGLLRRAGRLDDALFAYLRSGEVSRWHPYPLLNAIKIEAKLKGKLEIGAARRFQLRHAEQVRVPQVAQDPPYDAPWSAFDLAEIRLYLGQPREFLRLVELGAATCSEEWQPRTFRDTLGLLGEAGLSMPELDEARALLEMAEETLARPGSARRREEAARRSGGENACAPPHRNRAR
jgi:tetratricopeptide (TPR) repeat protein